jgi:hypothetical protein
MFTYKYGYTFNLGLNLRCVKFQTKNITRTNHDGRRSKGDISRATGHGFRATASAILNENGFAPDVIERQLELLNQQLADLLDLGGSGQLVNLLRVKVAGICKLSNLLPQKSTRTQ